MIENEWETFWAFFSSKAWPFEKLLSGFGSLLCGLQHGRWQEGGRGEVDFGRSYFTSTFLSSDTQSVPPPQCPTQQTNDTNVNTGGKTGNHSNFWIPRHSLHLHCYHFLNFHPVWVLFVTFLLSSVILYFSVLFGTF